VHIDPPAEHKAYLHRSGRTARAGGAGDVVTVVLPEQRKETQLLMRKAGITVTPQRVAADSAAVHTLVGEAAPHRIVTPEAVPAQSNSHNNRPRRPESSSHRRGRGNAPTSNQPGRSGTGAPRRRSSGSRTR
jgi:superfamily II DNA/RNA helicase